MDRNLHGYDVSQGSALKGSVSGGECCAQTTAQCQPPTLREEAEKNMHYHWEQAEKSNRSVAFLAQHPEFDEFIRLVRSGTIHF